MSLFFIQSLSGLGVQYWIITLPLAVPDKMPADGVGAALYFTVCRDWEYTAWGPC